MSYSRWSGSDWYIYWHSYGLRLESNLPEDQQLAVWSCYTPALPVYSYAEVRGMLADGSYTEIPGFSESSQAEQERCVACLRSWVQDVHDEAPPETES